jgi:hypothetical protein
LRSFFVFVETEFSSIPITFEWSAGALWYLSSQMEDVDFGRGQVRSQRGSTKSRGSKVSSNAKKLEKSVSEVSLTRNVTK